MKLEKEQLEFLKNHFSGFVSTASPEAKPWGAVVYYTTNDQGDVLFLTKSATTKLQHIRANPNVAFVVYDQTSQETIQLSGMAYEVHDAVELELFQRKLNRLVSNESLPLPIQKLQDSGEYTVVKIEPTFAKYYNFSRVSSVLNG